MASRGCGEPAHQCGRYIKGVLNIGFALGDISGPALRYKRGKKTAGDAKFYVGGHWISETPSVKGLHIEALRRRLARAGNPPWFTDLKPALQRLGMQVTGCREAERLRTHLAVYPVIHVLRASGSGVLGMAGAGKQAERAAMIEETLKGNLLSRLSATV
ncbi:hypothetical protein [Stenotrophomonas sp. SMYL8]|uniref:hypothetical protein n=1 Tax=Stenotrophomonas sp. SMYL8 TaxID=3076041 RepID=UPI002E79F92C|nr:hypothetical protein [Stenotrophomonas sp. SMYL8]